MSRKGIRSLRALSRDLGLSHSTLNTRLSYDIAPSDRKALSVEDLYRIGRHLGVEPDELIARAMRTVNTPTRERRGRAG